MANYFLSWRRRVKYLDMGRDNISSKLREKENITKSSHPPTPLSQKEAPARCYENPWNKDFATTLGFEPGTCPVRSSSLVPQRVDDALGCVDHYAIYPLVVDSI